jgi:pimeloyl-ACP methyl ester carboxylesterase
MLSVEPSQTAWSAILLHGALRSKQAFEPLISALRPFNLDAAVAIDLPGHGEASQVRSSYLPEDLAAFVMERVPASVFDRPTFVIAQSFSGICATLLPGVAGVVMLDTPLRGRSAESPVNVLARTYARDPAANEWIPRLLEGYFGYRVGEGFVNEVSHFDRVEQCPVPIAMITGEETRAKARARLDGQVTKLVGTFAQISAFAETFPGEIQYGKAPACFTAVDVEELNARGVENLSVHVVPRCGHNVLSDEHLPLVSEAIGAFAERVTALYRSVG